MVVSRVCPVHKVELPAFKVPKVYNVTGVFRTRLTGSLAAVDKTPAGSTDFMNFIDFINF